MTNRNVNRKFIQKEGKGIEINILLPPLSRVLLWCLILLILSPWIIMIARLEIWKKVLIKFLMLFQFKENDNELMKKNDLFG